MSTTFLARTLGTVLAGLCLNAVSMAAERQTEFLDRGLVAIQRDDGNVFLSWRFLGDEASSTEFNVYRVVGAETVKLNQQPIRDKTNFVDRQLVASDDRLDEAHYFIRAVENQQELPASQSVAVWHDYLEIPIQPIQGYRSGDASVGDLDGDGQYEIVLHQVSRPRDNSHSGITGTPILDAYKLDGTHLWRIDLGINIRDGEHYTQFMVYDLDGDGRAEVACKTADGTTDGAGVVIGNATQDYRNKDENDKRFGRVLAGPEFFTIFDGWTGRALKTVDYIPSREPIDGWGGIGGNGGNDEYGNRCDRFLACVAYLDGERPSLVMCRGVYGRTVLVAWDWRDGALTRRWTFDSGISYPPFADASPYSGMGGHSLSVADVDADGKDEIVYQAMVVDDNGKGLYSTGLRHGDSMHISDMYPDRPGLEVFTIQENEDRTVRFQTPGASMRDARTGEILWSHSPGIDVTSGLAADIDPRYPGYEAWGGPGGVRDRNGKDVGPKPRSSGFAIWWDGDLLRELVSRSAITKWNWEKNEEERIFDSQARGGTRGPNLVADLIGDWREELLMTAPDGKSLRLYTTTEPTSHRLRTLMHDPQYRLSVAWQNVVYNKPAHPSFFLGHAMEAPPPQQLRIVKADASNINRDERPQANAVRQPIPDKLVVLTFDDSAKSHFTVVRPLLKQYGFGATFFITEGFDFTENKKDYMTWQEIAQLHQDGFEIGNHTRDHLGITDKSVGQLDEQLAGIEQKCLVHGIPKPTTFAWPGNATSEKAFEILNAHGIAFARRGGAPEYPYEEGRGFAYEPGTDHPLLLPSAGDARPDWTLDDFVRAVKQASEGRPALVQFHGTPDTAHSWVNTPQQNFEAFMKYLAVNKYKVVSLRELAKYVNPDVTPMDPMQIVRERIAGRSRHHADTVPTEK